EEVAMKHRNRLLPAALCATCILWASAPVPSVDPKLYLDDVKYLASPDLHGRMTGTPDLETAAAFIAGKFREFGLKPADGKNYYQAFEFTASAKPGKDNRF